MKEQMNKLEARKMTTVYFIKSILVVCVALDSNKNLQKSPHIYKMPFWSGLSLFIYFYNKRYVFPTELIVSTSDFHHTMQLTEKTDIFFLLNICIFF